MELNFEIEEIKAYIKNKNIKNILLQLPEGLKPKSNEIIKEIKKDLDCEIYIWLDSCYGACDIPYNKNLDYFNIEEIIQLGHSKWN